MVATEKGPRAPGPGHHLVMDQQDAVTLADFAYALEIAVGWDERGGRGAADRLHDKGKYGCRPFR